MGTSAGALAGSLYAAGLSPQDVATVLRERPPLSYLQLNADALWTGLLRMDGVVERLRELLPATFEELPVRFACGVIDAKGAYRLVDSGPLPEAVVASAAVPCLFRAIDVRGREGGPFADGGKVDRVGLLPWRGGGGNSPAVVHLIERSSRFSGDDDVERAILRAGRREDVLLVRSPRSGQSLVGLTDFDLQFNAARERAQECFHSARPPFVAAELAPVGR